MAAGEAGAVQALEQAVLAFACEQRLFEPGGRVIVAVSGGADSMALLMFLKRHAARFGVTVEAAHVNHGLRGAPADADEAFVRRFCAQQGIPLQVHRAAGAEQPPPHAGEDWARRLRYRWFDRLAAQGARIATAHTLTDQAETLLLRLARGTGPHGAAGIPVRRGPYVRPFLCVERAHTEAYCAALHVPCVQDETNQGDAYARNRLRHHALPAMQSVNPQAVAAMGRFCRQMAQVDAYFAAKAETLLQGARVQGGWRTEPLCSAEPPVRAAALLRLTADVCEPSEPMVRRAERLLQTGQGAVQLAPGALLRAQGGLIWLEQAAGHSLPPQPFGPGEYRLPGGFGLRVELLEYKSFAKIPCVHKKDLNYAADYAKIQDNVLLRTRKPGDRFSPRGRGLTKTLKRYLNEQKVPLAQRALLPLAARGGQVLWLWGAGFAEGLAPGPATRQVLRVTQLELEDV